MVLTETSIWQRTRLIDGDKQLLGELRFEVYYRLLSRVNTANETFIQPPLGKRAVQLGKLFFPTVQISAVLSARALLLFVLLLLLVAVIVVVELLFIGLLLKQHLLHFIFRHAVFDNYLEARLAKALLKVSNNATWQQDVIS